MYAYLNQHTRIGYYSPDPWIQYTIDWELGTAHVWHSGCMLRETRCRVF